MRKYSPPPIDGSSDFSVLFFVAILLTGIATAQTPDVDYDGFPYRASPNNSIWVHDWSDEPLTNMFEWHGWPLHFVNTRALILAEDTRDPDLDLIVPTQGEITNVIYNIIIATNFNISSQKMTYGRTHEGIHAHTTDPASLFLLQRLDGGTDTIELHWEIDDRHYHLRDKDNFISYEYFNDFIQAYQIERIAPGETEFSIVATGIAPVGGLCSWTDGSINTTGEYRYRVLSYVDGDYVAYSYSRAIEVVSATPTANPVWVNSITGDHPNPDNTGPTNNHVLNINLGAYHDAGTDLGLTCDVRLPNASRSGAQGTDAGFQHYDLPLTRTQVSGDLWEYTLEFTWDSGGQDNDKGAFVCKFNYGNGPTAPAALAGAVFTTAPCNRIRNLNWLSYLSNILASSTTTGMTDYETAWLLQSDYRMNQLVPGHAYDGIWGDTADNGIVGYWNAVPDDYSDDAQFAGAVVDFIQQIRSDPVMNGKILHVNGKEANGSDMYAHVDGVVAEDIFSKRGKWCDADGVEHSGDGDTWAGGHWIDHYNIFTSMLADENQPDVFALPYFRADNIRVRRFSYASFLGATYEYDHGYYSPRALPIAGVNNSGRIQALAEQLLELGAPDPTNNPVLPDPAVHLPILNIDALDCSEEGYGDCIGENYRIYDLWVYPYDHGIVLQNINHWCQGDDALLYFTVPAGETYYQVVFDDKTIFDGGGFTTIPVSGTVEIPHLDAVFLMFDPVSTPVVAPTATSPVFADQPGDQIISVQADFWNGEAGWIEADLSELIGPSDHTPMPDLDGDGVNDTPPLTITAVPGTYAVEYYARGSDGLGAYGEFEVVVQEGEGPTVKYLNVSNETGLDFAGRPYGAVTLDYDRDGSLDLFVSSLDDQVELYSSSIPQAGATPQFSGQTDVVNLENISTTRGSIAADLDNDGYEDLAICTAGAAQIYFNRPDPSGGRIFEPAPASMNLAPYLTSAWSISCADYDRDNDLDLYIARAGGTWGDIPRPTTLTSERDYLLRNDLSVDGTFTDVSDDAEGMPQAVLATSSAVWADIDNDGDPDLLVPSIMDYYGYETAQLYINQGDGTFTEEFTQRFGAPQLWYVSGAAWADLDRDGHLDLVTSIQTEYNSHQRVFLKNPQASGYTGYSLQREFQATGVKVFDFDLDGWDDILFTPLDETEPPQLLWNRSSPGSLAMVDVTEVVGLSAAGRADGVVASDFNSSGGTQLTDGDLDLFLGRPVSGGNCFYKAVGIEGGGGPVYNYLTISLNTHGANNTSAIGTMVSAVDPNTNQTLQTRWVNGGSGRGGQDDRILTFGLGDYSGDVTLIIDWPGGHHQTESIAALQLNPSSPIEIDDETNPVVDPASLSCHYTLQPNGLVQWTFEWDTDVSSKWDRNKIVLSGPGSFGTVTRWAFQAGAMSSGTRAPDGSYHHVFVLDDQPCHVGTYTYTVFSSTETQPGSSASSSYRAKFCPTF